jgi:transglutaminase-like putative cysteine protease
MLSKESIDKEISKGNFTEAGKLIRIKIAEDSLTENEIYDLNFRIEIMRRIAMDFSKTRDTIISKLKKYYPVLSEQQIKDWEDSRALENITIDGRKMFFNEAVHNLFRIDLSAKARRDSIYGPAGNTLGDFLEKYLPEVIKAEDAIKGRNRFEHLAMPVKMRIKYTVEVPEGTVPAGETIRAWLPYPHDLYSQRNIKFLSAAGADYIIAPDSFSQRSIYMEKKARKGKSTIFGYELEYVSYNHFFRFSEKDVKPYDTSTASYKHYTAQRAPHVIFTKDIKHLSDSLTAGITNPVSKALRIYDYIKNNYPWASAREYSTIKNIPQYVLDNHHGDCGQVALLFITMARYEGIPARWQSGWMMHPGDINLHDWAEAYFEGIGWVPVDQSFGRDIAETGTSKEDAWKRGSIYDYYMGGLDAYRFIVNSDFSRPFYPAKIYPRSETVDFQRGELEWKGGNLYFNKWHYNMEVSYIK